MELYWRLPVLLQEAALSAYALYLDQRYYGTTYEKYRRELMRHQEWSPAEAMEWQNRRLEFIVQLAATRVPHYREQWRQLDWRSVRSVADFNELPSHFEMIMQP